MRQLHRSKLRNIDILGDAGWHCSFFMTVPQIQDKIAAYSHQELNIPKYTTSENIADCIKRGRNIFHKKNPPIQQYLGSAGYPWPCGGDLCSSIPEYPLFMLPTNTLHTGNNSSRVFTFDIEASWNHRQELYVAKLERIRKRKEMSQKNIALPYYDPLIAYLESGRGGQSGG